MVVYEYECTRCGYAWEERLPMGTPMPTHCPDCKCRRVRKVFSPPAIQFKGEGFHANDYDSHGPRVERTATSQ